MIHPAVIITFFAISILVGILISPLAQLAWLVIAAVSYTSVERFVSDIMKNLRLQKLHTPQHARRRKLSPR